MNFNHLEIFCAVAEAGSVTRGAERLLVSQPAVSKQLKQLERALGVELLDRRTKPLEVTEAGKLLARYAKRIFALANDAEQAIDDLQHLRRGRLSIGASPSIIAYLFPEPLVKFRDRFPGVRLRLETANSTGLRRQLERHELDLGFSEVAIESPYLESKIISKDEFAAIAPADHPLTKKRSVELEEFCKQPLVVRDAGAGRQSFVERALHEQGLSIRPVMALGSTEAVKRAIIAGLGCAIVPRRAIGLELVSKRLTIVNVRALSIHRPLYQYELRGKKQSKSATAFLCLLKHALRGTLPPLKNNRKET